MTDKIAKKVYVVTRNSRRTEDRNYESRQDAECRAEKLVAVLKHWKDPDLKKIKVVATSSPSRIR
tara:strand:- start:29 stop:223 length:195 start_codon:yes stop_codon:yes gene_type:complete